MASIPKHVDTSFEDIDSAYERLQKTFASHKTQSLAYRLYNLKQLGYLMHDNEERIQAAVAADLQKTPFEVDLSDVWPALGDIDMAVRRLPEWMKDDYMTRDATAMFKLARPRVHKQPKGVALIIGAWNYPWTLTIGPLVGAIAAGCPAIVKGSEHSPASSALLAELIPRYLDPDGFAVVLGGPEQATHLLEKRWGHILYTGSGGVGKIVATAAAQTLTPTTLELGGKSPVIITSDADLKITARRLLSMKQVGSGQVCVSPDYVLCVKDRMDEFVKVLTQTIEEFWPKGSDRGPLSTATMTSGLRNSRDFDRLAKVVDQAEEQGKLIYRGETDEARRRMGVTLVRLNRNNEGEDSLLAHDEVFGPVLSITPVDDVDAAIRYINSRPTPLALYVCSSNRKVFEKIVDETLSGSAIWNDFELAPVSRTTPFGGVGESGWGAYHGYDGFLTFTHRKTVLEVPLWMELAQKARYPGNLNDKSQRLLRMVLNTGVPYDRPVSVEHEARAIERRRTRRHLYIGALIVLVGAWLGLAGRTTATRLGGLVAAIRARLGC